MIKIANNLTNLVVKQAEDAAPGFIERILQGFAGRVTPKALKIPTKNRGMEMLPFPQHPTGIRDMQNLTSAPRETDVKQAARPERVLPEVTRQPERPTAPITAYKASALQAGIKSKPYINPNSAEGRLAAQTNGPGRPLADQRDQFGAMNMETAMADARNNRAKLEAEMRAADTLTNPQTPDYRYDAVESMRARRPGRL